MCFEGVVLKHVKQQGQAIVVKLLVFVQLHKHIDHYIQKIVKSLNSPLAEWQTKRPIFFRAIEC